MLDNWAGLTTDFSATAYPPGKNYTPEEVDRFHKMFNSQVQLGITDSGIGILWQPDRTSLQVSDAGGFNIGLKKGRANVLHPTWGPARLELSGDLTIPLAAESTLYIYIALEVEVDNDSRVTSIPYIAIDAAPTYEGGEPLALVTTDDTGITSVVDLRTPCQAQDVDIHGQTEKTTRANNDELITWDSVTGLTRRIKSSNFLTGLLTNVMTAPGDIIYGATSGTQTRLPGNTTTTRKFLRQTGTGSASAAPAWDTVTKTDVGLSNADNTSDASKPVSAATQTALDLKADLVSGKVPASQLPAYVDDVLEFANLAGFPGTGETGKLYIAIDTNLTYRWTGSTYAVTSSSLALGETSSTAYRGDRGKTAYDHSQVTTGNPHGTTAADVGAAATSHTHAASAITSGVIAMARLATGTADGTKFIRDDGTLAVPSGGGVDGNDGWTPVFAVVSDSARRVLQVTDWVGGEGTEPATGKYVGATGLETLIADGVDIRGSTGAAGSNGTNGTNGAGYAATSTTSLAIGTGSKAFTTQAGLAYLAGARVRATSAGDTSKWMEGVVSAYSGTTLTVTVDLINDSGTLADWNLNIAGQFGGTRPAYALTDGSTIATDASLGEVFTVTLGGNRTLSNPTNAVDGMRRIWRIKQDATGSRTLALGTNFRLGTDVTSTTLTTTALKTDYLGAIYNGADSKWDVVSFAKGF